MYNEYERQSREHRAEANRGPSGAANFKRLRAPVGRRHGRQVTNHVVDQQAVMDMLDKLSVDFGGNRRGDGTLEVWWPLANEGNCDLILWNMILRVQNTFFARGELRKPDGVIDPDGTTQRLIMRYSGHVPSFPAVNVKDLAKAAIPTALTWAHGAITYLVKYKAWRTAGRSYPFDATAANTHLHLDKHDDTSSFGRVAEWIDNYRMIIAALNGAEKVFVRATREEALAARIWMNCWGVVIPAWALPQPTGNIWFGPDMIGLGVKCRAAILLHEGGHYIRAKIGHQGGERGKDYDEQTADQALTSAYVCANFATHATTGRDERFGLARPKE